MCQFMEHLLFQIPFKHQDSVKYLYFSSIESFSIKVQIILIIHEAKKL